MNSFDLTKKNLVDAGRELAKLFESIKTVPGINDNPFEIWAQSISRMEAQMAEGVLRVAVVGSIKSGKSTFVNSFFGGDFVKRGAGVVTCIVTRIRPGDDLCATLYLKSWEEVNAEIEHAMVLFPAFTWRGPDNTIDIRRKTDREKLGHALELLSDEQLITQSTRNMNAVLISSYLQGYDKVKDLMDADSNMREFDAESFSSHKEFVGNESLAVYLKDVCLSLALGMGVKDQIEVADCQGSDSPNPLHLAMIEDYLLKTHFIIYVISSRTGVRQADIRFLSLIKKMGLVQNIYFIINCDFSEHESIEDLRQLVQKITQEISIIRPDPDVFCFSALFNLFSKIEKDLSDKDAARLSQWKTDTDMRGFSDYETKRFLNVLDRRLTKDRMTLLLKNDIDRLNLMVSGVFNWLKITREILSKDAEQSAQLCWRMDRESKGAGQLRAMIKNTLDGVLQKAQTEITKDVDSFFDPRYSQVMTDTWNFIQQYNPLQSGLLPAKFSNAMYAAFCDLKHAVDRHMAENVNPIMVKFVRNEEEKIAALVNKTGGPYNSMVEDALGRYEKALAEMGISIANNSPQNPVTVDVSRTRRVAGLNLPALTSTMRYSAKVRTEAIMRKGLYSAISAIKKLFKKQAASSEQTSARAMRHAIARMKDETCWSLKAHFMDFRENLKFQYLFRLLELASFTFQEDLGDRLGIFAQGMAQTRGMVDKDQAAKQQAIDILDSMEQTQKQIAEKIILAGKMISS